MAVDFYRSYDPSPERLSRTLRLLAWSYLQINQMSQSLNAIDMAISEEPSVAAKKMKLEILLQSQMCRDVLENTSLQQQIFAGSLCSPCRSMLTFAAVIDTLQTDALTIEQAEAVVSLIQDGAL